MRLLKYFIFVTVIIPITPGLSQGSWPQTIIGYENTWIGIVSPVNSDLESDGIMELVVTTQGTPLSNYGSLCIFEANGDLRARTYVDYYFDPRSFPTIADIDGDGNKEVLVEGNGPGGIYIFIFNSEGDLADSIEIDYQLSDDLYGCIVLADIDNDDFLEIVYGGWSASGAVLVALELDGVLISGFPVMLENSQMSQTNSPAVGNLDADENWEIVTISHLNNQPPDSTNIRAFESDGDLLWSQVIYCISHSDPVIGDIDDDGDNEVAFTSENGVYILENDGSFILNNEIGVGMAHSNVALADLDNDNDLEIIFGYGLDVYAIHHDGSVIFSYRPDWVPQHPPVVGDINGDNSLDIVFNSDNDIYALNNAGDLLPGFPMPMEMIAYSSPSIDDINRDGAVDLISSSNWLEDIETGIIYLWELGYTYNQAAMPWQMYQHDPQHTGNYGWQAPVTPDVSIEMIPESLPIEVNPGGSFSFTGILQNNTESSITGDVWIMLELPGGATFGPLQQFNNILLNPNQTITVPGIIQSVPGYAPMGTYGYISYCGDYPVFKMDSSSFEFTVIAPAEGGADGWNLFGWFDIESELPRETKLHENYPNPFNPITTIRYDLTDVSNVRIEIYNLMGQRVETLIDSEQAPGEHSISWDASNMASGIYFYKLSTNDNVFARRMILLK